MERLWGRDVFIDIDASVNTAVRKIRRALRDSADGSRFVQTVQGKGYKFIADLEPTAQRPFCACCRFATFARQARRTPARITSPTG